MSPHTLLEAVAAEAERRARAAMFPTTERVCVILPSRAQGQVQECRRALRSLLDGWTERGEGLFVHPDGGEVRAISERAACVLVIGCVFDRLVRWPPARPVLDLAEELHRGTYGGKRPGAPFEDLVLATRGPS